MCMRMRKSAAQRAPPALSAPAPPAPPPPPPAGSTIKQGERHCVVYATGMQTFFGRAAALLGSANQARWGLGVGASARPGPQSGRQQVVASAAYRLPPAC